jgi:hypothetical protein
LTDGALEEGAALGGRVQNTADKAAQRIPFFLL